MKRKSIACLLLLSAVLLTGCPSSSSDVVTDADQSAIEAYKAEEAREQAALQGEMKDAAKAK